MRSPPASGDAAPSTFPLFLGGIPVNKWGGSLRGKKVVRRSGTLIAINKLGRQEEAGADLPEVGGAVAPELAGSGGPGLTSHQLGAAC